MRRVESMEKNIANATENSRKKVKSHGIHYCFLDHFREWLDRSQVEAGYEEGENSKQVEGMPISVGQQDEQSSTKEMS